MNVNRFTDLESRFQPAQPAPAAAGRGAFLALPLPAALAPGQGPSFVEALYQCAFERARAEQQPRRGGPDLFACWN